MAGKKKAKPTKKKPTAKQLIAKVPGAGDAFKRLGSIEDAGKLVLAKQKEISAQETKVGNYKAALDTQREVLSELRREEKDLADDLLKLSQGKFSERLNFADNGKAATPAAKAETKTDPAPASDAWRSLKLAEMGLTDKRALSALEAAGIETFGDAEGRLASNKPIANFGDGARQKYDDAKVGYFAKNPQPTAEKPNGKHTAPGDQPGKASRGNAVDREKKDLTEAVNNALAFAQQEVNPVNGTKLLAFVIGTDPVAALESATLDQLAEWKLKIRNIDNGDVVNAVRSTYAN